MRDVLKLKALAPLLLLGGCVAGTAKEAPPVGQQPEAPTSYSVVGLENVIGRDARFLEAQFGAAALDVREGAARKLQWIGPACVLDAYLYPPRGGRGEPIVTHVDARLPNGNDFDRASCVSALIAARARR